MVKNEAQKFILDNWEKMSDDEMARSQFLSVKQVRRIRKKFNLTKPNTFGLILEKNNLPTEWRHGWIKDKGASIFIKAENNLISYDEMRDEMITDMKDYAPKYPKIAYKTVKGQNHLLVIDPADVHIGKLSIYEETGQEYNQKIATKRCLEGVAGILEKSKGFAIDKILLVIGNDILHIDTPHRTTTAGTAQDTDGQWWEMFKTAKSLYVQIIETLMQVAPVHIVFNPSNHDYASGFMLADSLSSWFHNAKDVSFDVSIAHRKYFKYNESLICTSHGDGAKESDMPLIMASESPQDWASSKFRYIYLHHIHHKKHIKWQNGKDYIGATVEYLRTPSATDGWHSKKGYVGVSQAIEGFVHSKENGQIARLTHYF